MNETLASRITQAASRQTYYTIRFLADRQRAGDAFRAYAYFRWVDDELDGISVLPSERKAFLARQVALLEACYRGKRLHDATNQEGMLIELVQHDLEKNSGLQIYLRTMMKVMNFDARRRDRLISQGELDEYTRLLATAVTECIHFFVGHDGFTPCDGTRYLAVSAAHIVHMLRDTFEDASLGYYNIPREILEGYHLDPLDVNKMAYRAWVKSRVLLAREYFKAGKAYFARVENPRCRLACFAYIARFEWLLDTLEREGYRLRPQYNERKTMRAGLKLSWLALSSFIRLQGPDSPTRPLASPGHSKA